MNSKLISFPGLKNHMLTLYGTVFTTRRAFCNEYVCVRMIILLLGNKRVETFVART